MSEVADELVQAASTEIVEYSQTEAALADLRARMANVEYDVTTVKGLAVAKADRAEVRGLRTSLEATRKQIKAPALAHCKLIDDEAKRITAELLKLEEPIDTQIKAREAELEAERAAREAAEKARIMAITEKIAGIRQYVELAASCRTAARVDDLLTKLSMVSLAGFEEFADEAASAHLKAMEAVIAIFDEKTAQEAEQARIKAEQAEAAATLKAEREAFAAQQAEADRLAAEHASRVAAERAEFEAAQAVAKVEAARLEAERQAKAAADAAEQARQRAAQQAELDRQRAEIDAANAAAQAAAEAQRAALAAERAAFEAQQAEARQAAKDIADRAAFDAQSELDAQSSVPIEAPVITEPEPAATDDAREETAMWNAITAKEPSDADCMWIAISAVAKEYDMTTEQATARLAAIQWTI